MSKARITFWYKEAHFFNNWSFTPHLRKKVCIYLSLAMTNKLVVIIKSLKLSKFKKILLYEMKFLVQNYSCLQNPWLVSYAPDPPSVCSLSSTEFVETIENIPGYATCPGYSYSDYSDILKPTVMQYCKHSLNICNKIQTFKP